MRLVIQRVKNAAVNVDGKTVGSIGMGLFVLVGVKIGDDKTDADFLADKLVNLRVFSDEQGKMNLSALDVKGEILLVSNFTLYGNAQKGRRPDFVMSEKFEPSKALFDYFVTAVEAKGVKVATGEFGADMKIPCECDGPVTIIIDSELSVKK